MKTFYDVQQLLMGYGIVIYFKDELDTIEMMKQELKGLHDAMLVSHQDYIQANLILNQRSIQNGTYFSS